MRVSQHKICEPQPKPFQKAASLHVPESLKPEYRVFVVTFFGFSGSPDGKIFSVHFVCVCVCVFVCGVGLWVDYSSVVSIEGQLVRRHRSCNLFPISIVSIAIRKSPFFLVKVWY
jgi:hypothetical protein